MEILNKHEIARELVELAENNGTSIRAETHPSRSDSGGIRHYLHHRITIRPELAEPNPRSGSRLIHIVDAVRAGGPVSPKPRRRGVEDFLFAAATEWHAP